MLPKDILNIISLYNEDGIFVKRGIDIYWFNSKRFEFWCKYKTPDIIMTYNHDLYIKIHDKIHLWKNKQLIKIEIPWNHPLKIFSRNQYIEVLNNSILYRFCDLNKTLFTFDGHTQKDIASIITKTNFYDMMSYKNCIYLFGDRETKKYNIQTSTMNDVCVIPRWFENHCLYDFNGKFYDIGPNNIYFVYDPEIDIWEERKFVECCQMIL